MKLEYFCDTQRHLVCKPYSVENLRMMAADLQLADCWFHKDHYDIPLSRIKDITARCTLVSPKYIVYIINNPEPVSVVDAFDGKVLYNKLTAERIHEIMEAIYTQSDSQQRKIVTYTGIGGAKLFDEAMKQAAMNYVYKDPDGLIQGVSSKDVIKSKRKRDGAVGSSLGS